MKARLHSRKAKLAAALVALTIAATGGVVAVTATQAQAWGCTTLAWNNPGDTPASWMTWIPVTQSHHNARHWTSNGCPNVFQFFSQGMSFEPDFRVQVRLVFYDRNGNFDWQTGWYATSGLQHIPLPDYRVQFSWYCRDSVADRRRSTLNCRYAAIF